jgi:hypothetical protein
VAPDLTIAVGIAVQDDGSLLVLGIQRHHAQLRQPCALLLPDVPHTGALAAKDAPRLRPSKRRCAAQIVIVQCGISHAS